MIRPLLLLALLAHASSAVAQAETRDANPLPGAGFAVESYAVALRPDLATASMSGTETIVIQATADRLTRARITDATADGAAIAVSGDSQAIVFTLPRPLNEGEAVTLRFSMEGTPKRGVTRVPGGLYTSYFACDWMVCLQDTPGDKATFALDLFLPPDMVSMGVGLPEPLVAATDGLTLHRWRTTGAFSPYLYAFAAGPFARRSLPTPQGEMVYLNATGETADLDTLFAASPQIAGFLADKAGVALPDRRYVQLLTPDDEAQESASFSLIGKDYLDDEAADSTGAWAIAQEMAHQWWGNLVTCATWRDFWLNEGITTFMVAAWKEQTFGPAAYEAELDVARRRLDRARDAGFDMPLAWGGQYPSLGARRAVQYSKGALFMDHLRKTIGDDAFWKGLRTFTQTHAGGRVTSRDFQSAMEGTSGTDLTPMFNAWVYGDDDAQGAPPR